VVGDDAERSVELDGQVPGTGDALAESLEDAGAQRMRERFGDPSFRRFARGPVAVTG